MRKNIYNILLLTLFIICSFSLISCNAITAQNIDTNSSSGMGGGPGGGGGPGMDRNQHEPKEDHSQNNDTISKDLIGENTSDNLIGKVESIDANSIKVELISLSNENSDDSFKITYTGTYKILEISDTVTISKRSDTESKDKSSSSESSLNASDLKKDELILIKYKEDTEIAENISIIKS